MRRTHVTQSLHLHFQLSHDILTPRTQVTLFSTSGSTRSSFPNGVSCPFKPTVTRSPTPCLPTSSSQTGSTGRMQIFDDEKKFTFVFILIVVLLAVHLCSNVCSHDLAMQIERWGLRNAGFPYNTVADIGFQSTGKSGQPHWKPLWMLTPCQRYTFEQVVLGTFDVMDATKNSRQPKVWLMSRGNESV